MDDVRNVAKWFLSKESMTHKKLQKLCYYAQAWYCALYDGTPLFSDEIQAWIHGPVVPSLYQDYKQFKWTPIDKADFSQDIFTRKTIDVLEAVYDTYGEYTGDQLESLTHSEDPWKITRGNLKPWEPCYEAIPTSLMRDYYRKQHEQSQND